MSFGGTVLLIGCGTDERVAGELLPLALVGEDFMAETGVAVVGRGRDCC